MKVVILVPRRDDGGWRDQLWAFCIAKWRTDFPEWTIVEGHHTAEEGLFNRSKAINRAAENEHVRDWDVALIIDSDTISDPPAVREAVEYAFRTNVLTVAHNARKMMSERATKQFMTNPTVAIRRHMIEKTYYDSVSCAVAVSRQTWDLVGGFDERFIGWGFEDTAFRIAAETLTDSSMHVVQSDCYHLWHKSSPEASHFAPSFARNNALKARYEQAHFQPERVRAVIDGLPDPAIPPSTIPRILHRTVPAETSAEVEGWWAKFASMHPQWDLRTYREPIDPADFPLTGDLFARCQNGAQKAGLIRLEVLVTHGGVYVDSDVEPIRPLDALIHLPAFAAWEDEKVVPDAVLGSSPGHPAFRELLRRARASVELGEDAWKSGPGGTTAVLPWRDDVLLLPPGSFYPAHYLEKARLGTNAAKPWVFLEHKWHHSWGSPKQLEMNRRRQIVPVVKNDVIVVDEGLFQGAVICMPWKPTADSWRLNAHDWCMKHWQHVGAYVYEGTGDSRAAMCNEAAQAAISDGNEILIFADADTWVDQQVLLAAVKKTRETGRLTHAFSTYAKVGSAATRRLMRQRQVDPRLAARGAQLKKDHVSGVSVIPVDLWKKIGGFDERFTKWGFEDQAFHLAASVIGGGTEYVDGIAVHWYHHADKNKTRTLPSDDAGLKLITEYCQAAGSVPSGGRTGRFAASGLISIPSGLEPNPLAMTILLSRPGGPLSV